MSVISCLHQNLLTVNYSTRQMPGSGDDITTDSDIIRRSHGIKTDSSEMRWLGRGRLNVTQEERKRSMRVNLWLWQLPPADAAPPPPLHPLLPLPTPGKSPARWKQSLSLSLYPWRKCGKFSHQMTALCIVIRRLMYLSWDHKEDWAGWNNTLIPPSSPLTSWILSFCPESIPHVIWLSATG